MASTDPVEVERQLWRDCRASHGLDVGARRGESVEDFKRAGCSFIQCIEPSPTAFQELVKQTYSEDVRVYAYNVAISDHNGTVKLASVLLASQKGELVTPTDGMEWSVPDWNQAEYVEAKCWTIDTWCRAYGSPDLVKVDTEGHECKVLDGALDLISKGCTWLIEFHSPQNHVYCVSMLASHSYDVETIRHPHYAPGSAMWQQHGWIRAIKG